MVNAVILTGTHADKSKLIYGQNKALLEINNKPIILNVLQALQGAEPIDKIAIVGPKQKLERITQGIPIVNESLAPKESRRFIENAMQSYNAISPNKEKTLFVTADLPFIVPETIEDFVSQSNNATALYFGLVNVRDIPQEFEDFKKSSKLHLKGEGNFRTANMVLYDSTKIQDKKREILEARIERAFPIRRTDSRLAKLSLYTFLAKNYFPEIVKYLLGILTEQDIEKAFDNKLGVSFKFIKTEDPRALIDIDYAAEYEFIKRNYDRLKIDYKL